MRKVRKGADKEVHLALLKAKDDRSKDPKNLKENSGLVRTVVRDFMATKYIKRVTKTFADKDKLERAIKHGHLTVIECRNLSVLVLLIFGGGKRGDAIRNMLISEYDARRTVNGMVQIKVFR